MCECKRELYDKYSKKLEEINRNDGFHKYIHEEVKEEIHEELRNLYEEKEEVIRQSSYDDMRIEEIRTLETDIDNLEFLLEELDDYLSNDKIKIRRWYIFNLEKGIKYFEHGDVIIDNAKEYIESLKFENVDNTRISIGAEYIRNGSSIGMSEFICRENLNDKFNFSDDIRKVNIQITGFNMFVVEYLLKILNS